MNLGPDLQPRWIIDLFGGPGGWSEGLLRYLGLIDLGIEWDHAAVATRTAAGHTTVLGDVAALDPRRFIDERAIPGDTIWGLIASPPCPLWSAAGKGHGRRYGLPIMAAALAGLVTGRDTRPDARRELADLLEPDVAAEHPDWVDELALPLPGVTSRVRTEAERLAAEAALVLEPARWAYDLRPAWIALEQVPACLPVWEALGSYLEVLGYQSACAVLNCADYGIPQTRKRAIFVARLGATAALPAPTHAEDPTGDLAPWVTMGEALGWDGDNIDTPARTVCGARVPRWMHPDRGGDRRGRVVTVRTGANSMVAGRTGSRAGDGDVQPYERPIDRPAPTLDRKVGSSWRVGFPRRDDLGGDGYRERDFRDADEPSFTVTEKTRSWKLVDRGRNGAHRAPDELAMTITASADNGNFRFVPVDGAHVLNTGRDWKPGGDRYDAQEIGLDQPAPSLTTVQGQWVFYRPATTIAGDSRVWAPGHKINADDVRRLGEEEAHDRYGDRAGTDAIRLEVPHALVLQSFRPDYPVQGTKTDQFRQVGDAVPPLLAAHIVAALIEPDDTIPSP